MKLDVNIAPGTGAFEVCENGTLVVNGVISALDDPGQQLPVYSTVHGDSKDEEELMQLTMSDVYKELRLRGYEYGGDFQGILSATNRGAYSTYSHQLVRQHWSRLYLSLGVFQMKAVINDIKQFRTFVTKPTAGEFRKSFGCLGFAVLCCTLLRAHTSIIYLKLDAPIVDDTGMLKQTINSKYNRVCATKLVEGLISAVSMLLISLLHLLHPTGSHLSN